MSDIHDMPTLCPVSDIPVGSKVLLRMDLDVPMKDGHVEDADRLMKSLPTINVLLEKQCVIVICGHLGRPKGIEETFSLKPVCAELVSLIRKNTNVEIHDVFVEDIENEKVVEKALGKNNVICLENLRFFKGEEENDPQFLETIVKKTNWFVNDALAVAHRKHRSMMLFKTMQTSYGISFIDEVTKLMYVIHNPNHPITIILGGAKEDKLTFLEGLEKIADHILIGGKLPTLMQNKEAVQTNTKYCIASLTENTLDLSAHDITLFINIISSSKTIVWAGAMGFFEDPACRAGTEAVAKAVVASGAYTVLAGGDTEASVSNLGEEKRINLVASGGGVMLELLTKGTLPAW